MILLYQVSAERGHMDDAARLLGEIDTIGYVSSESAPDLRTHQCLGLLPMSSIFRIAMGRMAERIPLAVVSLKMLNDMLQAARSGVPERGFFQKEGVDQSS